jgi:branched-chain amino acid transport system permease protein
VPYAFETPYSQKVFRVAGTFFTLQSVIIIAVSTVTIALLYAFMKFTFLGKALRAVSQDRETAGLMGINPNYLIMLTFDSGVGARRHGRRDAGAGAGAHPVRRHHRDREGVRDRDHRRLRQRRRHDPRRPAGRLIESFTTQYLDPGLIDIVVFGLCC